MAEKTIAAILLSAALVAVIFLSSCTREGATASGEKATDVERVEDQAQYTDDGRLIRPDDWREWVFVGMPVTPNALNGGKAVLPEAQAVYIDRTSWSNWKETGTFRDGTMFAVELTMLKNEGAHEDGSTDQIIGRGYFQDGFSGLMFSIKDSVRYADEPGNWAYFTSSLGPSEDDYPETMVALPTEACNACHEANGADDWVFSQFYPVLTAAGAE
jgi:hypothetical protein